MVANGDWKSLKFYEGDGVLESTACLGWNITQARRFQLVSPFTYRSSVCIKVREPEEDFMASILSRNIMHKYASLIFYKLTAVGKRLFMGTLTFTSGNVKYYNNIPSFQTSGTD